MWISEVETPALIIDLDALEHNIGVIADCYRDKSIRLRPHVKNHKSPRILGMQMAAAAPSAESAPPRCPKPRHSPKSPETS